jgi:phosphoserine phosphatase
MRHVITFIAENGRLIDLHSTVQRLTARFAGMPIRWLSEGACDVEIEYRLSDTEWRAVHETAHAARIDAVMQPLAMREKKLLLADMDSTLIEQECLDELAEFVGKRAEISAITERAMNGELDFEAALRARVIHLAGLPQTALGQAWSQRITFTPGVRTMAATMKHRGAMLVVVSGGFDYFTHRVATELGFDAQEANHLECMQGHLTGNVREPILGKDAKRAALTRYAARCRVPLAATLAVGDGANDLPMLLGAGLGVAYRAKPVVNAQAKAAIRFNDLSALLYLQGIPRRDWVEA